MGGKSLLQSKEKAIEAAKIALSKKAKDTIILELKTLSTIADYFVICSGESSTQIKTIAEKIGSDFSKLRIAPLGIEGQSSLRWVLMDYGDVVVHVFNTEVRDYYQLEKLWMDAPRIPVNQTCSTSRRPAGRERVLKSRKKETV